MSELTCSLGVWHSPQPLPGTVELHHVIPVAWQLFWQPKVALYPYPDSVSVDTPMLLWDARTLPLCAVHHRNVHSWVMWLMREVERAGEDAIPFVRVPRHQKHEFRLAQQGLRRFLGAGGSVFALAQAHELGRV